MSTSVRSKETLAAERDRLKNQRLDGGRVHSFTLVDVDGTVGVAVQAEVEEWPGSWCEGRFKAEGLQDAADKRSINADAKRLPISGKALVTKFALAGTVGRHFV